MIEKRVVSWPPCWVAVDVKAPDLAVQRSAHPQPARLIKEVGHLRVQTAEARAGTHNNGVIIGEVFDLGHRGSLVALVVRLACDLLGDQLRHASDVNLCAGSACAFGHRIRHRFDMAVSGIVKHQYLGHLDSLPSKFSAAADRLAMPGCVCPLPRGSRCRSPPRSAAHPVRRHRPADACFRRSRRGSQA